MINKKPLGVAPPKKPAACTHPHLIPIEWRFGTETQTRDGAQTIQRFVDWTAITGLSATRVRVHVLWCPLCGKEITLELPRKYYP